MHFMSSVSSFSNNVSANIIIPLYWKEEVMGITSTEAKVIEAKVHAGFINIKIMCIYYSLDEKVKISN